jgi:hypothetical protein
MFNKYQSDARKMNFLQQGKVLLSFRPLPAILDSLSFHISSHSDLCKELIEVSATSFKCCIIDYACYAEKAGPY